MNRRINIGVTFISSLVFLALTAVFWQSYARFGEACRDFGLSVAYYFCELFGLEYSFFPTVTQYSEVVKWQGILPSDLRDWSVLLKTTFLFLQTVPTLRSIGLRWGMCCLLSQR